MKTRRLGAGNGLIVYEEKVMRQTTTTMMTTTKGRTNVLSPSERYYLEVRTRMPCSLTTEGLTLVGSRD